MAELPTARGASNGSRADTGSTQGRVLVAVLLGLSFGTGVIDAVSFLELDVFTAIMTGNVVFVGVGLTDQVDVPVLRAPLAIAAFAAGALLVGRVQRHVAESVRCPRSSGWLLLVGAFLVAIGMGWSATVAHTERADGVLTAVLGVAMGIQVGAVRRMAVPDLTTVVFTLTLARWAEDSRLGRGDRVRAARRLTAIGLLTLGALIGALLLDVSRETALALPCLVLLAAGALVLRIGEPVATGSRARVAGWRRRGPTSPTTQ